MAPVSRRTLLAGALGIAGVGALTTVEFGRHALPTGVPHTRPGTFESGTFHAGRSGSASFGWSISTPPVNLVHLPVLVVLHGRGGDHRSAFRGGLYLDRFLADAVARGTPPFAVASLDGGDHSYWHPRASGDFAARVTDQFVSVLAEHNLDVSRIGLLGWSMGGYGALYLAGVLGRSRCAVAVAESPAIWHDAGQSASGAFDDAADFDAHSIFEHLASLRGIPLRIDCGASDGFAPVTRDLRAALSPTPAGGIEPGGHNASYWRSQATAQLEFVGQHLGRR